jgi:hypothetical protein
MNPCELKITTNLCDAKVLAKLSVKLNLEDRCQTWVKTLFCISGKMRYFGAFLTSDQPRWRVLGSIWHHNTRMSDYREY